MKSVDTNPGTNTIRIEAPHLLLVEGKDEELFFRALVDQRLASGAAKPQVIRLGGKDRFGHQLRGLAPDIRDCPVVSVGVVRDADEHAARALQSVCDALAAVGFSAPGSHGEIVGASPRVGVFVMPDGRSPGALEALCQQSVESEPAGSCVLEYLDCLKMREGWGTGRSAIRRSGTRHLCTHTWRHAETRSPVPVKEQSRASGISVMKRSGRSPNSSGN